MENNTGLKQRMYHLVVYSLSGIQKGIQSYHSAVEYMLAFGHSKEFKQWAEFDKTVIILDGGTVNPIGNNPYNDDFALGTMDIYEKELAHMNIDYACFKEPDLNNTMTTLAFLCDERVWDREKYPDVIFPKTILAEERDEYRFKYFCETLGSSSVAWLRCWTGKFRRALN